MIKRREINPGTEQ